VQEADCPQLRGFCPAMLYRQGDSFFVCACNRVCCIDSIVASPLSTPQLGFARMMRDLRSNLREFTNTFDKLAEHDLLCKSASCIYISILPTRNTLSRQDHHGDPSIPAQAPRRSRREACQSASNFAEASVRQSIKCRAAGVRRAPRRTMIATVS
jgi:hypothetical protein